MFSSIDTYLYFFTKNKHFVLLFQSTQWIHMLDNSIKIWSCDLNIYGNFDPYKKTVFRPKIALLVYKNP